jgi:hypothetical protein
VPAFDDRYRQLIYDCIGQAEKTGTNALAAESEHVHGTTSKASLGLPIAASGSAIFSRLTDFVLFRIRAASIVFLSDRYKQSAARCAATLPPLPPPPLASATMTVDVHEPGARSLSVGHPEGG